jgi:hypothetical protein
MLAAQQHLPGWPGHNGTGAHSLDIPEPSTLLMLGKDAKQANRAFEAR